MLEPTWTQRLRNHGHRVVTGQRLLQAGARHLPRAGHGSGRQRLLRPSALGYEGRIGRQTHTRRVLRLRRPVRLDPGPRPRPGGDEVAIAAYLGKSDTFDHAVADSPSPTPMSTTATTEPRGRGPGRQAPGGQRPLKQAPAPLRCSSRRRRTTGAVRGTGQLAAGRDCLRHARWRRPRPGCLLHAQLNGVQGRPPRGLRPSTLRWLVLR